MKILLTTICLIVFGTFSTAQTYEIRLISAPSSTLLVQLRASTPPPPATTNRVQDIVFGIKWLQGCGANLDLINPTQYGFNIATSGTRGTKGSYAYRVFGADPTNFTLANNWTAGTWVTIYGLQSNNQGLGTCTFDLCEVGFDAALTNQTGPNFNIDFTDYTPTVNGSTNIVLPIELLNFDAKRRDKTVDLTWQTASEKDNKGFDIQRSADGKTFEKIGFVHGIGSSTVETRYSFTDESPLPLLNYYRLQQIDRDGKETLSKVVSVAFPSTELRVKVFPNPFSNNLTLEIATTKAAQLTLELVDALGRQVYQSKQVYTEGVLNVAISTKDLANGTYFLKVSDGQAIVQQTIIKE